MHSPILFQNPKLQFLSGGGEMGAVMRNYPWRQHTLGTPDQWAQSLSTAIGILLHSRFPMFLFWGDECFCFYNDAYRPSLGKEGGGKHPCIGKRGKEVWPEIWPIIGPQIKQVMQGGDATWHEDALVPIYRNGKIEDVYWTYSYSPVFNEEGKVAGVYVTCTETTKGVKALANYRETEQILKESEERLQAALDASLTGTFRWNIQTNELLWDENRDRLFGLPPGDTVKSLQDFIDRVHPDDRQAVIDLCRRCADEGTAFDMEFRVVWPDASLHWLDDKGKSFFDEDGKPLYMTGACVDITEHKESNNALEQSEEQFRTLSNAIPQLAWMTDDKGWIHWYNQRWYDYTGTTLQEMQGWGWQTVHHPDLIDGVIKRFQKALDAGEDWEDTFLLRSKAGEYRWFLSRAQVLRNSDGSVRGWFGSNTDITEQHNAANALAESESRFRTLANQAPIFIFMADEGVNVTYVNKALLHYLNLQHYSEFTGLVWQQHIHPEDIDLVNEAYAHAWQTQSSYHVEIRLREAATGQYNWFLSIGVPRFEGNIFKGFLGTGANIQAQKELTEMLEQKVRERTEALNAANRELQRSNEDLQQFAHVASHDLKEPIRKIIIFQNLLKNELAECSLEKANTYLQKIETSSLRMYSMIEGVLAYSILSATAFKNEAVDLNDVLKNIEGDLEVVIAQKGAVINRKELTVVQGSPVLLYQLFYNLVANSLKFAKAGVPPVISITSSLQEDLTAAGHAYEHLYEIVLQDNGIGFNQDEAEKIFQTFSRLNSKDRFEGTGLGLSLCKKIVERHAGTIRAEGELGVGARFIVRLPA